MPGEWGYIVAAYAVTWLVFVSYALWLERVTRRALARRREADATSGGHYGRS